MHLIKIKTIVMLVSAAVLIAGCFEFGKTITVLFHDSKGIAENANVYLAGVVIGKVTKIRLSDGKVALAIRIDGEQWPGLKTPLVFFIDVDPNMQSKRAVLVRNFVDAKQSGPLQEDMVIEGIDSPLIWSTMGIMKNIEELERSELFRYVQQQFTARP